MKTAIPMWRRLAPAALAAAAAAMLTACSIDKTPTPALTGPSEFGLSVTLTAAPDQLPRDGASQSVVTVSVRDANGKPVSGQRVNLSLPVNAPAGATLSQSAVTTDASGNATVAVTAPASGSLGDVVISAVPVGANFDNALARTLSIGIVPSNTGAPVVSAFTVSPTNPEVGVAATLTAGTTTDEGVSCTNTCTFSWSFGDGSTATGPIVSHTFGQVGDYQVTLTVTDRGGAASAVTQTVTVAGIAPPTTSFTVSPASPLTDQEATFTATATAQTGHRIATYGWEWGDGSSNQTASPIIRHTYTRPGQYLVVLTATDDRGLTTRSQSTVTVTSGLTASFTVTPSTPKVNVQAAFDASASTSVNGSAITTYTWDFGDGHTTNSSSPTATNTYTSQGNFVVTLTVSDALGRTGTTTRTVTVTP